MSPRCKTGKHQLEHWLWRMVDSQACYGVRWQCKVQRTFTIPWINQKTSVWKEDFSQLFTEYAKHRGKLPSEGKIDYPTCKQNFKSALAKKSKAVKCIFKAKDKKFRTYQFLADYSSPIGGDGGHDQQTRIQSSNSEVDLDGICNFPDECSFAVASEVSIEQSCLAPADKEGASPVIDFLHDPSGGLPGDANTLILSGDLLGDTDTPMPSGDLPGYADTTVPSGGLPGYADTTVPSGGLPGYADTTVPSGGLPGYADTTMPSGGLPGYADTTMPSGGLPGYADTTLPSGCFHEPLQGDSNLGKIIPQGDDNSVIKILEDLNLYSFANNSVAESSQIHNATVDSTTENQGSWLKFTDDGQNVTEPLEAFCSDALEGNREISTQLTNSKISTAGCTTTMEMDRKLLPSLVGNAGHAMTVCNNSGFLNSTTGVAKNQSLFLNPSSRQSLPSSCSSMDTSAEENSHNQTETALSVAVSSSKAHDMPGPQLLTVSAPSATMQGLMFIQVIYTSPQRVVKKQLITSNQCKIFFGGVGSKRIQTIIEEKDRGAVLVELPTAEDFDFKEESKRRISMTLKDMELGVVISYRDDDIYVVRRCQSHVYLTDGVSTSYKVPKSPMKKPDTEILVKAFDFAVFEQSVKNYHPVNGSVGRDYFVLTLGCEILKNDPAPTRVVPIRIDVCHLKARDMRFKTLGPAAFVPDPQRSISDSFDNEVHFSNIPMSMCS